MITKNKANQLLQKPCIHVAEWHSNLHTSGACVISFCVAIVAIVFLGALAKWGASNSLILLED